MSDRTWRGNPKLEPLLVPVESISTHPRNPRRGDLPLLAESLDAFGQTRPIVVQPETGWIVAGNHTYRAALEVLAWTHIAAVRPELEPGEYEKYLLMDNRASDASEYDENVLIPILEQLQNRGDFEHTGWDPDSADDFIAGTDRVAQAAAEEFAGGYAETPEERDARAARAGEQRTVNQLMLAYNADDHAELTRHLGMLRREYGTSGVGETIARAVDEQYAIVWGKTA